MESSVETITIKLEADFAQAIEGAHTFEEAISRTDSATETLAQRLGEISGNKGASSLIGGIADQGSFQELSLALAQIRNEITETQNAFQHLVPNISGQAMPMLQNIRMQIHSITKELHSALLGNSTSQKTDFLSQVASLSASRLQLEDFRRAMQSVSSFAQKKDIQNFAGSQSYIDKIIRQYTTSVRGSAQLDELIPQITQSRTFSRMMQNKAYDAAQQQAIARMLVMRSKDYQPTHFRSEAARLGLADSLGNMYVTEQIPQILRDAYRTYGNKGAAAASGSNDAYFMEEINKEARKQFRQLVRGGNQSAIQLGIRSGLLRMNQGEIEFGKINRGQWGKMAGLAAQRYSDAKTGLPFMWQDRNDIAEQERMIKREGHAAQELEDLMRVLQMERNFVADASMDRRFTNFVRAKNTPNARVIGGWLPEQFIIPNTRLNKETGQLNYIDPATQISAAQRRDIMRRVRRGEERPDDPFVTMGSSSITQLLGLTGNNTFGFGRDENGRPIRRSPFFVKMNTTGAIGDDPANRGGNQIIVDTDLAKRHADITDRRTAVRYGDQDYVYGWTAQNGRILMNKVVHDLVFGSADPHADGSPLAWQNVYKTFGADAQDAQGRAIYDQLVRRGDFLRSHGLTGILDGFMTPEVFAGLSASKQSKFIDSGRKKATPSVQYFDFGFQNTPNMAMVDFNRLYDWFGVPESDSFMRANKRIDGVSWIMPQFAPSGMQSQMRAGLGWMKFVAQAQDWRKEYRDTGYLRRAYQTGKYRWLFDTDTGVKLDDKGNPEGPLDFWAPMMGLSDEESKNLISNMERWQGIIDSGTQTDAEKQSARAQRNAMRKKMMYNIMSDDYGMLVTDTQVKLPTMFQEMSESDFDKMFPGERDQARDIRDGRAFLSAPQQRKLAETITQLTGLQVSRFSQDFLAVKDFLPESLVTSLGYNADLRKASDENYANKIAELGTIEGQRRFLQSIPAGRRLLQQNPTSWMEDGSAKSLVQNQINTLKEKQRGGDYFFPDNIGLGMSGVFPGQTSSTLFGAGSTFGISDVDEGPMRTLIQSALAGDMIAAGHNRFSNWEKIVGTRLPAGPGENETARNNIQKEMRDALEMVGADPNMIYLTPGQAYRMMTGDFDGDTTWIFGELASGLFDQLDYVRGRVGKAREYLRARGLDQGTTQQGISHPTLGLAANQFDVNSPNAQIQMGLSTAAIRNAMVGWDDTDEKWLAIAEGIYSYDKATQEMKKQGIIPTLGEYAKRASQEGPVAKRLIREINKLNSGGDIGDVGVFRTRMPSVRDADEIEQVFSAFRDRQLGVGSGDYIADTLDAYVSGHYDDETLEGQAAREYSRLFGKLITGRGVARTDDFVRGRSIISKWQGELSKRRTAGEKGEQIDKEEREVSQFLKVLKDLEDNGLQEKRVQQELKRAQSDVLQFQRELDRFDKEGTIQRDLIGKVFKGDMASQLSALPGEDAVTLQEEQSQIYRDYLGKKLAGARAKQTTWETMLAPRDPMLEALEQLSDDERKEYEDEIRKRRKKLSEMRPGEIVPMNRQDLTRFLKVETAGRRTKMNWSDVAPWLFDVMSAEGTTIRGQNGISIEELATGARGTMEQTPFNPYPYNASAAQRERQKNMIAARELNSVLGYLYVPQFEESMHTLAGSARHSAFEKYFKQGTTGRKTIEELLAQELLGDSQIKSFAEQGIGITLEEDGQIGFSADPHGKDFVGAKKVIEGLQSQLGTFDPKTKTYSGGTLSRFIERLEANGEQVVNIEALNVQGTDAEGKPIPMNQGEFPAGGRGASISFRGLRYEGKDETGQEKQRSAVAATFAPDLITQLQNGTYAMYDYKTGELGALDSLFQMYVYASDILQKAQEEDAGTKGWSRFIDENGKLKFSQLRAYDAIAGRMYSLDFNEEERAHVQSLYRQAQENKQADAEGGATGALDYIEELLVRKYGDEYRGSGRVSERAKLGASGAVARAGGAEREFDFLTHKFDEDQDTIDRISQQLWRERLKRENVAGGGYNRYASLRRQLDDTLSDEMMTLIEERMTQNQDSIGLAMINGLRKKKADTMKELDRAEIGYVASGWKDIGSLARKNLYGVDGTSPTDAIFEIVSTMNGLRQTRESWKANPEYYKDGEWLDLDRKKAYEEQFREEQRFMQNDGSALNAYVDAQTRSNDAKLNSLIQSVSSRSGNDVLQQAYQARIDQIIRYVQQQEATIEKAKEQLAAKVGEGENAEYSLQGKEREAVEALLSNATQNRDTATRAMSNGQVLQKTLEERRRELSMISESPQERAKKWLEDRTAVLNAEEDQREKEGLIQYRDFLRTRISAGYGGEEALRKVEQQLAELEDGSQRRKPASQERLNIEQMANLMSYMGLEDVQSATERLQHLTNGTTMTDDERRRSYMQQYLKQVQDYASRTDITEEQRRAALQGRYAKASTFADRQMEEYYAQNQMMLDRANLSIDQAAFANMNSRFRAMMGGRSGRMALTGVGRTWGMERSMHAQAYEASTAAWMRGQSAAQQIADIDKKLGRSGLTETQRDKLIRERIAAEEMQRQAAYEQMQNRSKAFGLVGGALFGGKYDAARERYTTARDNYARAQKEGKTGSELAGYSAAMASSENEMNRYATKATLVSTALSTMGQTFLRVGAYFGRRLFQNAIREATQFVKVYDQTMRQIQAITMKSDSEMVEVRSKTIDQAIQWKTSASNVAQIKSDLYRQGLSDSEVDKRTESIVKFSTVTGAKVTQATKALTTAIQSGLVSSVEEAMDALTALGDSAATTAEEIFKGMQKSAAAASVAGVSYAELTSMLTVITSKTQLGGAQAGTALQTIFSRMRRVTNAKMVTDEGGETTSLNDVEESLNRVGVSMRADNTTFRSTTEILRDLAKVWNELNDVQKNNIMYNMAGARQANMFSALMEGLADEDGKTFDEYLGLAENSEGTTQSKYEIVIEGINAQIQELKQTFDGLVESFADMGIINNIIGLLTNFTEGLRNQTGIITAVGAAVLALAAKFAALLLIKNAAVGSLVGTIAAGVLVAGGVGLIASMGESQKNNTYVSQSDKAINDARNYNEYSANRIQKYQDARDNIQKAFDAGGTSAADWSSRVDQVTSSFNLLKSVMPDVLGGVESVTEALKQWKTIVDGADQSITHMQHTSAQVSAAYGRIAAGELYENYRKELLSGGSGLENFYGFLDVGGDGEFKYQYPIRDREDSIQHGSHYFQFDLGDYLDWIFNPNSPGNASMKDIKQELFEYYEDGTYERDELEALFEQFEGQDPAVQRRSDIWKYVIKMFSEAGIHQQSSAQDRIFSIIEDIGRGDKVDPQQENFIRSAFEAIKIYGGQMQEDFFSNYGVSTFEDLVKNGNARRDFSNLITSEEGTNALLKAKEASTYNEEDIAKRYFSTLMDDDTYFGYAVKSYAQQQGMTAAMLYNAYRQQNPDVKYEDMTPQAIYNWMFGNNETPGFFNNESFNANKIVRESSKPTDYKYWWVDDNGNPVFGFNDYDSEQVKTAIEEELALAAAAGNEERILTLGNIAKEFSEGYDQNTTRRVMKRSGYVNKTIGEAFGDVNITDKDRGFAPQYVQMLELARSAKSWDELMNSGIGMAQLTSLASETGDKQLAIMIQNPSEYSYDDIRSYLYQKAYGEDESAFIAQMLSSAENIAYSDMYANDLLSGTPSNAAVKHAAQAFKVSESAVRGDTQRYGQLLRKQSSEQKESVLQKYRPIISQTQRAKFGFGSREEAVAQARLDAKKVKRGTMPVSDFNETYKTFGIKVKSDGTMIYSPSGGNDEYTQWQRQFAADNPALAFQNGQFVFDETSVDQYANAARYDQARLPEYYRTMGSLALSNISKVTPEQIQKHGNLWNALMHLEAFKGYSEEDWQALAQIMPDLVTYLTMSENDRTGQYGQNVLRNINLSNKTQELQEQAARGEVDNEVIGYYQGLTSKQKADQTQVQNTLKNSANQIYEVTNAMSRIQNNKNDATGWYSEQNQRDIETVGQYLEWSEKEKNDFKDYDKAQQKLGQTQSDVTEKVNRFASVLYALAAALGANVQGVSNLQQLLETLQGSTDGTVKSLGDILEQIMNMYNFSTDEKGNIKTGEESTSYSSDLVNKYSAEQQQRYEDQNQINKMFGLIQTQQANGLLSSESLGAAFEGMGYQDWDGFAQRNPAVIGLLDLFNEGQITSPDDFASRFEGFASSGAINYSGEFMRGYNQYQSFTGENGLDFAGMLSAVKDTETGADFTKWIEQFDHGRTALQQLHDTGTIAADTLRALNAEVAAGKIRATQKYGDAQEDVAKSLEEIGAGGARAAKEVTRLQSQMAKINNMKTASNMAKGKSGKELDKQTKGILAQYTDFSEGEIENMSQDMIEQLAQSIETQAEAEFHDKIGNTIVAQAEKDINEAIGSKKLTVKQALEFDLDNNGQLDLSEIYQMALALGDQALAALAAGAGHVGTLTAQVTEKGNSISVDNVVTSTKGSGYSSKGGGGGGGGKSAAQKLLEKLKHQDKMADHRLKMLQLETSKYEDAGEITNVNRMLEQENKLRAQINREDEQHIRELKGQMSATKKYSEDWYSLRDAILAYEEKIKESNNAIAENNRKMKENQQEIRKLRTTLEDGLDQEIKNRIQRERDMLAGTVDMQNTILEAIKSRYQEEWRLVQKDTERKRQALEDEKSMIDERLNARKEAEDEAEKYEQLAEYRRQYALISMDSTRTKDAAELKKKIEDLEKEQAWSSAEKEAKARQDAIDDEIKAYDLFLENGDEDLQYMLENANNFSTELNQVIAKKDTELYDWLRENVTEYANSVKEAQQQIANGWIDTYNQMTGYTETWWDEIDEILKSEESYIAYMMQSQDYINASDTKRAELLYQWQTEYQDLVNAWKDYADWHHSDNFDNLGQSKSSGGGGGKGNGNKKQDDTKQQTEQYDTLLNNFFSAVGQTSLQNALKTPQEVRINSNSLILEVGSGQVVGSVKTTPLPTNPWPDVGPTLTKNAEGGLVDYTGLTWVDGSFSKPEAFLSAEDTALMRSMLDAARYLSFRPTISSIDGSMFNKNNASIGDINITITEASFKEDADYEKVAERVGAAFVKELNRQGLNMANYSF